MAIANAVGSNVFDILLGLGVPWMLVPLILDENSYVDTEGIVVGILILMGTLIMYICCIACNGFMMNRRLGVTFVAVYCCYIAYTLMNENCVGFKILKKCQ